MLKSMFLFLYHEDSMRRIRKNSQPLFYRGDHGGDRDAPVSVEHVHDVRLSAPQRTWCDVFVLQIPGQPGRDAKIIQSIASLIRAKSQLLLLENPVRQTKRIFLLCCLSENWRSPLDKVAGGRGWGQLGMSWKCSSKSTEERISASSKAWWLQEVRRYT